MAEPFLHRLLVISDGTLATMAGNAAFLKEFPFLKLLRAAPRRRCCGGSSTRFRADVYQGAKRTIAYLASDRKALLKQMLRAHQLRVIYREPNGQTVERTF